MKIFLLTILTLIAYSSSRDTCEKFVCGGVADPAKCHLKNNVNDTLLNNLRVCPSDQYCSWNKLPKDSGDDCTSFPKPMYYPGSACNDHFDCIGNGVDCVNNVCAFVKDGDACKVEDLNCKIGSTCRNVNATVVCAPVIPSGGNCTATSDCDVFNACHSTGVCTPLYSVDDGKVVTDELLCKSGYTITSGDPAVKTCWGLTSKNSNCTVSSDCVYSYNGNLTTTFDEDNNHCLCAYTPTPSNICLKGNADAERVAERNEQIALTKLQNVAFCHQKERNGVTAVCAESLRNPTFSVRKQQRHLENLKVTNEELLKGADACTKYVVREYNDQPVLPDKFQCPKYSCNKQDTCYYGVNPMNEDGGNITVSLYNYCQKNQTCAFGVAGQHDTIFDKATVNGTCSDKTKLVTKRFPGEDCDSSNTCLTGDCTNGVCTGATLNQNCTSTSDCVKGHFCNSTNLCVVQLKENEACSATWDCANHLGCFNSKCVPWGSQSVGTDLNNSTNYNDDTKNQGFKDVGLFCELGEFNGDIQCSQKNYTGTTVEHVDNKTGFATCNWNEDCHYTDGKTTSVQTCGCAYNAKGQGYCPLASGAKNDVFKKSFKKLATQYKNECHSKARFNCYNIASTIQTDVADAVHDMFNAHLFIDAVKCASDVLGSAYINMSIALISVLVALLI